jgi:hypothetical protein
VLRQRFASQVNDAYNFYYLQRLASGTAEMQPLEEIDRSAEEEEAHCMQFTP